MSPTRLMSLTPRIPPRAARGIAAACGIGVLALGSTACGSSDDPTNASAQTGTQNNGQGQQTDQQGQFPGANGKVAAVTDNTAQVQGQDGQVAVTWNGSTTFTQQIAAKFADVKVGACVMVQSEDTGSGDDATAVPTAITATTVRITEAGDDGTCAGGFGGPGGGQRPQFNGNGTPPSGAPTGAPGSNGGNGGPQVRGFGGAFGEVTAVSATGFTVTSPVPQMNGGDSSSTPTVEETEVAVTVTAKTTYTTTGTAAASDVKVGSCLRAEGTTDDTGAVTATTVALSPATDGECGSGFRRGNGGPGAGGPGGGSTGQES